MVDVTDDTKFSEITIQGMGFAVPIVYAEGHPLTANQAAALNQVLAENLRNNFASKVKEAVTAAAKANEIKADSSLSTRFDSKVWSFDG